MLGIFWCVPLLLDGWECAPPVIGQRCWEAGDDLSCDEATEISAVTLLLTLDGMALGGAPVASIEPNRV